MSRHLPERARTKGRRCRPLLRWPRRLCHPYSLVRRCPAPSRCNRHTSRRSVFDGLSGRRRPRRPRCRFPRGRRVRQCRLDPE